MAKKITIEQDGQQETALTQEQERFCQLYVCGGAAFAGRLSKCYKEVFGEDYKDVGLDARRLLHQPQIITRIKELVEPMYDEAETAVIKTQISETLRAVMEETSTDSFCDKFGNPLSPAPLRAVSVNAAKALMELYPVKHVHETRLKIENADGGVVFNVIVPQNPDDDAGPEE
jgi:phage terminase small subunit